MKAITPNTKFKLPLYMVWSSILGLVVAAYLVTQRVDQWENTLNDIHKDCCHMEDLREFATDLRNDNPPLKVPDVDKIVQARRVSEHGGELMMEGRH